MAEKSFKLSRPDTFCGGSLTWETNTTVVCQDGVVSTSALLLVIHSKLFKTVFENIDPTDCTVIMPETSVYDVEKLIEVMTGKEEKLCVKSYLIEILNIFISVHEVIVSITSTQPGDFYMLDENWKDSYDIVNRLGHVEEPTEDLGGEHQNDPQLPQIGPEVLFTAGAVTGPVEHAATVGDTGCDDRCQLDCQEEHGKAVLEDLDEFQAHPDNDSDTSGSATIDHDYYEEKVKRRKIICSICSKKFQTRKYLIAHIRWKHCDEEDKVKQRNVSLEKSQNSKCNICGKVFNSRKIREHVKNHFDDEKLQCLYCDKMFSNESHLNRHVLSHHEVEKKYKCDSCNYTATRKDNVDRHFLLLHTNIAKDPQFECELCGENMKTKDSLKKHRSKCHGKKQFMCEKCSKTAKTKAALWKHIQRYHHS